MQTGKGNRKKGICFTILPKQAALPCERPHEETERQRDENPAPCFILHPKKNPPGRNKTEMQARNASTNAVGEKNLATKIRRENFAPHSTIVVAREGFGEENRKKKKPGDRGEANLRRQNHEARFQPRTKEQQKKHPSSTSLRDGSRVRRAG
jgi:hypothetical protein